MNLNVFSKLTGLVGNIIKPTERSILKCVSQADSTMQKRMSSEYYTDWRMQRDAKRRRTIKEFAKLRLQLNAMRKNSILPKQFQEVVSQELHALPIDGSTVRAHGRCVITSRARGKLTKWRMSRIVWRQLADHNHLSGVIRAMW